MLRGGREATRTFVAASREEGYIAVRQGSRWQIAEERKNLRLAQFPTEHERNSKTRGIGEPDQLIPGAAPLEKKLDRTPGRVRPGGVVKWHQSLEDRLHRDCISYGTRV